MTKNIVK